jgi:redox-sensitive bicupin YhaK (pirin superfamily)
MSGDLPMPIELTLEGRTQDLGGFAVRRVLPQIKRRMVGPFIFLDHMGPATFNAGAGLDVRPHPHIGLATFTYLYEGEILHRDSLGSVQPIRPGAVNWMIAGRGIVHSERTPPQLRAAGGRLHGIQIWVALPKEHEEAEPEFHHHQIGQLPRTRHAGAEVKILLGEAYGERSPVKLLSPAYCVDAIFPAGATLPMPEGHAERAVYVVDGAVVADRVELAPGRMAVFAPDKPAVVLAKTEARVMLLGGAPFPEPRHIWWNFVATSKETIEEAKKAWEEGLFDEVPGESERIPLPAG